MGCVDEKHAAQPRQQQYYILALASASAPTSASTSTPISAPPHHHQQRQHQQMQQTCAAPQKSTLSRINHNLPVALAGTATLVVKEGAAWELLAYMRAPLLRGTRGGGAHVGPRVSDRQGWFIRNSRIGRWGCNGVGLCKWAGASEDDVAGWLAGWLPGWLTSG